MSSSTILVIRATGSQGTAVLKNAQKNNITTRAYVTDKSAPRAQALLQYGAELYEGTLGDAPALEKALTGCDGVFLNQLPSFSDDTEVREAKVLLELARKTGIKHIVHSTSLGVPRREAVGNSTSITAAAILGKAEVEDLLKASGIEYWTILRPGYFNTNLLGVSSQYMFPELGSEKKFVCSYKPDWLLPLIDPFDIGAFAVAAFVDAKKFNQAEIAVVAEKRAVEQVVKDLSKASRHHIQAVYRTDEETEELAKTDPVVAGARWMVDLPEVADLDNTRQWGIPMRTFPEFLEVEKDAVRATFAGMSRAEGPSILSSFTNTKT